MSAFLQRLAPLGAGLPTKWECTPARRPYRKRAEKTIFPARRFRLAERLWDGEPP